MLTENELAELSRKLSDHLIHALEDPESEQEGDLIYPKSPPIEPFTRYTTFPNGRTLFLVWPVIESPGQVLHTVAGLNSWTFNLTDTGQIRSQLFRAMEAGQLPALLWFLHALRDLMDHIKQDGMIRRQAFLEVTRQSEAEADIRAFLTMYRFGDLP